MEVRSEKSRTGYRQNNVSYESPENSMDMRRGTRKMRDWAGIALQNLQVREVGQVQETDLEAYQRKFQFDRRLVENRHQSPQNHRRLHRPPQTRQSRRSHHLLPPQTRHLVVLPCPRRMEQVRPQYWTGSGKTCSRRLATLVPSMVRREAPRICPTYLRSCGWGPEAP